MFTIKTLTKYLMTIEDQDLPVKVCVDDTKLNLEKISLNNTGYGGWDQGEIRLQATSSKPQATSNKRLTKQNYKII